jgi:hypothetical protein
MLGKKGAIITSVKVILYVRVSSSTFNENCRHFSKNALGYFLLRNILIVSQKLHRSRFECIQKTAQTGQFVVRVHRHLSCRFPLSIQETKAGFETGVKAAKFQTDPLPRIERRR